jgi:hypothetical protein
MSNLFEEVLTDVNGVQQRLLGPDYKYYDNIKTPSEIGMSDKGDLTTLSKDVNGLIAYTQLLVEGSGPASKTGKPLGNKFFLKTGGSCLDKSTQAKQDRYIYINNVPTGNIPFISSGIGGNFSEFKGLVPGTLTNLNAINPFAIMQAFLSGATPECQPLTMETIDVNNNRGSETHYVTTIDIQNMDPCIFPNNVNPINQKKCKQLFQNMLLTPEFFDKTSMQNIDKWTQLYFISLSLLGIYFLFKASNKR